MPPIMLSRFREEERTGLLFKLRVLLRLHNSLAMFFLHCSVAHGWGLLCADPGLIGPDTVPDIGPDTGRA